MIEFRVAASPPAGGRPPTAASDPLVVCVRGVDGPAGSIGVDVIADDDLRLELDAQCRAAGHRGASGVVEVVRRPGRSPAAVVLVGVGNGAATDWRAAGAAVARTALSTWPIVHTELPADAGGEEITAYAEGAILAGYRFVAAGSDSSVANAAPAPTLRRMTVHSTRPEPLVRAALVEAAAVGSAVTLARDLTNAPSAQKSPRWFADRIRSAAGRRAGVSLEVLTPTELRRDGFGGILAVGAGSSRPPRLVQLVWEPPALRGRPAPAHVVLVGKGVTFDSGGYSIKPLAGMQLMRKDMAGAAAACATVLAAADLALPVRVTALAPLAENLVSGSATRPGDVITHYGGLTTEVQNTDAEGRLVLADALAYAAARLSPDIMIDLATLTGAARVALGQRTAAVMSSDDDLVAALGRAGESAGEPVWRLPLVDDYAGMLASDVADLNNAPAGGAGAIAAALFLREFTGAVGRWAHLDFSAPSWSADADGPLTKGATGWGVRLLVRWLASL